MSKNPPKNPASRVYLLLFVDSIQILKVLAYLEEDLEGSSLPVFYSNLDFHLDYNKHVTRLAFYLIDEFDEIH
jgi:hypothetical protein